MTKVFVVLENGVATIFSNKEMAEWFCKRNPKTLLESQEAEVDSPILVDCFYLSLENNMDMLAKMSPDRFKYALKLIPNKYFVNKTRGNTWVKKN